MEDLKCTNCGNQMSAAPKAPQQVSNTPQDGKCPHCGLGDIAIKRECHNSACSAYACEETIYEGWKATPPQQQEQSGEAGSNMAEIHRLCRRYLDEPDHYDVRLLITQIMALNSAAYPSTATASQEFAKKGE